MERRRHAFDHRVAHRACVSIMPDPITCYHCICFERGYALAVELCRELRRGGLCQKQVAMILEGQGVMVIEGERVKVSDEKQGTFQGA